MPKLLPTFCIEHFQSSDHIQATGPDSSCIEIIEIVMQVQHLAHETKWISMAPSE